MNSKSCQSLFSSSFLSFSLFHSKMKINVDITVAMKCDGKKLFLFKNQTNSEEYGLYTLKTQCYAYCMHAQKARNPSALQALPCPNQQCSRKRTPSQI